MNGGVTLVPVDATNWRQVGRLRVTDDQRAFVAEPLHYLALGAYGGQWQPLAIVEDDVVVGHLMWAVDPEDGSTWLGGVIVDHPHQGRGLGRAAVVEALRSLHRDHGARSFALTCHPDNGAARALYLSLGFVLTGEHDDDEEVMRLEIDEVSAPIAGR